MAADPRPAARHDLEPVGKATGCMEEQRKLPDSMRALGRHAEVIEAVATD
jgi:hypothetical protein